MFPVVRRSLNEVACGLPREQPDQSDETRIRF
jgi:hypothetical protein